MIIETWGELVSRLDTALAFAKELRLETEGTRFISYRNRIAALELIRVQQGDAAAFDQFRAEIEPSAVAFSDSQELTMVLPFLQSVPQDRAKKKLQVVLNGPELPSDEDTNSNHARNTMFELNLAARLQRAGFSVDVREDADLDFTCNGGGGSASASARTNSRRSSKTSKRPAGSSASGYRAADSRHGGC